MNNISNYFLDQIKNFEQADLQQQIRIVMVFTPLLNSSPFIQIAEKKNRSCKNLHHVSSSSVHMKNIIFHLHTNDKKRFTINHIGSTMLSVKRIDKYAYLSRKSLLPF